MNARWLPLLAFGLPALGAAPDDGFRSERQILRHLTVKLAEFRSDPTADVAALSASVSRLTSVLDTMTAQAADLDYREGRVRSFKATDLDPKSRAEARLKRDYDAQLKPLKENLAAFIAANDNRFRRGSPEHIEAQRQADAMVKEINRVVEERDQKIKQAILAFAAAQKDYAGLLRRRDEAQAELDESAAEFRSLRGPAVTQMHSLDGAVRDLRRAAGAARLIQQIDRVGVQRPLGSLVFDHPEGPSPVDLPDVAAPDGSPGALVLPSPPNLPPDAPRELADNPRLRRLREKREALEEQGRILGLEKARLFADKKATSADWMAHDKRKREHGREAALNAIDSLAARGGSALLDMSEMNAKPLAEPPPPGKDSR